MAPDGKRIRAWICPFCDGTILAPRSLAVHIERDHPEHGIEPREPAVATSNESAADISEQHDPDNRDG